MPPTHKGEDISRLGRTLRFAEVQNISRERERPKHATKNWALSMATGDQLFTFVFVCEVYGTDYPARGHSCLTETLNSPSQHFVAAPICSFCYYYLLLSWYLAIHLKITRQFVTCPTWSYFRPRKSEWPWAIYCTICYSLLRIIGANLDPILTVISLTTKKV